ncbi:metalloprotease MEP1-like protein [Parathielavia hyrcaniae]|uniref:Metalloprotease MEP1-like protein n=1 Tax=Parathielavia hyrcaniae TaxID=113614 RepID=A0AAN6T550_9PEZI|nr:metalloprotease MEP1-like protein [Parathielavia hyrcaniae]
MRFTFALAALAAHSALAIPAKPSKHGFSCGAPEPDAEHIKISQQFAQSEAAFRASGNVSTRAVTTVDTYFHVVASSTSLSGGYLTDAMLTAQLNTLNQAFAPHSIQFSLKGTTRTVNANWAADGNGYEMTMKRALRKGTYRSLNVYFLRDMGNNLGYCYFPSSGGGTAGSTVQIRDGCTVLYSTVPGGSTTNYNRGHTTTHEVGHWFGLYHTFQGGCTGAGDSVSDTPAQASSTSGCPIGRDSCPSAPGLDPIHNYMDYSYDSCYEEFTAGQRARMQSFWNSYRAGK